MSRKEVLANSVVILMSVFLMFSVFEGVLAVGVFGDVPNHWAGGNDVSRQYCVGPNDRATFHPEYGWVEHPNSRYLEKRTDTDDWSWFAHNADGFRDTYDSGSGNVVVLGDSFTRGSLVDQNATFAHLLDRWSPNTSVHNYGTGGYGTDQELLVYRNVSDQYDHDVVVLGYYLGNDMADNVAGDPQRPQFAVRNGTLVQTHEPENVTDDDGRSPRTALTGFLDRNTDTYSYVAPRIKSLLVRAGVLQAPSGPPSGDELRRQVRLTRALVAALADATRANDATLLIVPIPEAGEVNPDKAVGYTAEEGRQYWNAQREMLSAVAEGRDDVHVLDIRTPFEREIAAGNEVYDALDGHADDYGHRIMAREIHGWLRERGYVADAGDYDARYDTERTACSERVR